MTHRALHLIARPDGQHRDSDFEMRESASSPLLDGQIRVAVKYLSIDPAMRVWMSEQKSYWPPVPLGEVMRSMLSQVRSGEMKDPSQLKYTDMVRMEPLIVDQVDPLRAQAESFIAAIREKQTPQVTVEEGQAAVETAERIVAAIKTEVLA